MRPRRVGCRRRRSRGNRNSTGQAPTTPGCAPHREVRAQSRRRAQPIASSSLPARAAAGACAHIAAPSARCPRRKWRRRRAAGRRPLSTPGSRAWLGVGVRPRARACARAHERMTMILGLSDTSARRRTRSRRERRAPVSPLDSILERVRIWDPPARGHAASSERRNGEEFATRSGTRGSPLWY